MPVDAFTAHVPAYQVDVSRGHPSFVVCSADDSAPAQTTDRLRIADANENRTSSHTGYRSAGASPREALACRLATLTAFADILLPMRLLSADHASVDLSIARYQFPGRKGQGTDDWDANWLQVAGTVVLADRKTWTFEDPCLTTWEAAELGRWLNSVADGSVQPSPFGPGQDEQLLVFTEPNVAFSLQERIANRVRVRVHFSLEALPPWLQGARQPDMFDYFVVLDVSEAELRQAAGDWTLNLGQFPPR